MARSLRMFWSKSFLQPHLILNLLLNFRLKETKIGGDEKELEQDTNDSGNSPSDPKKARTAPLSMLLHPNCRNVQSL